MSDLGAIHRAIKALFVDVEHTREELHAYQADVAIPFLRDNPFSALFIDMGLGKTVSSLTVIADLLAEFDNDDKVLIIGPPRVALETWPTEIALWQHTAHLSHKVIHVGDKDPRLAGIPPAGQTAEKERLRKIAARSPETIHIIPNNWVDWLVDFWGPKWPYRTVFIDESSNGFKDQNSKRFQAMKKIRNTEGLITRLHLLTATPAAETYEHLFPQIYLLDKGERLGKNITTYRNAYFTFNKWKRKFMLRDGCEDEILDLLKDICLVMKAEDYLNLEKPTILRRPVHLDQREKDMYATLEKDFIVTLDDGTEIEAETAAALSQKLLQLCSGVLYETIDTFDKATEKMKRRNKVHHIHDHKIEELKQIVEELDGKSIMVGYHFKSSLDRLQQAFPKAVVMDKEGKVKKAWNAGKIKMLLMHPMSGGHGLNLQAGGNHIAFFDIPWSLELYLQFIGRLARQGQKSAVIVWLLTAMGTLDELVSTALQAKEDAQDKLFSKLKRAILKYRKEKKARQAMAVIDDEL